MNGDPDHPYVGMWVTADGCIRHELLPKGRYDEARNGRAHAYQGRYRITGTHIDYVDDTGFTADGEFVAPGVLHHAGMVFTRLKPPPGHGALAADEDVAAAHPQIRAEGTLRAYQLQQRLPARQC